mgnify:CR=1 FL=1
MPSTAKPRRICGRPLRSRQTLIICSAIRTGGKIRPRSVSPGRIQQALAPGLWDNLSRSPAGLGSSPNKHFCGPAACKNFGVWPHPNCLPFCASPGNGAKTEARVSLYASSVSLAAFIAWIVASTIFNSFSSRALSIASMRFLHSLPLFLDG